MSASEGRRLRALRSQQTTSNRPCGYEVIGRELVDLKDIYNTISWISRNQPQMARFFLIDLLRPPSLTDITGIAECADTHGLRGKLCFASKIDELPPKELVELMHQHQLRVVLDDVSPNSRVGDLGRIPLNGVRIQSEFLYDAFGDPVTASLLDGVLCAAKNLSLITFGSLVSNDHSGTSSWIEGLDYVPVADFPAMSQIQMVM